MIDTTVTIRVLILSVFCLEYIEQASQLRDEEQQVFTHTHFTLTLSLSQKHSRYFSLSSRTHKIINNATVYIQAD